MAKRKPKAPLKTPPKPKAPPKKESMKSLLLTAAVAAIGAVLLFLATDCQSTVPPAEQPAPVPRAIVSVPIQTTAQPELPAVRPTPLVPVAVVSKSPVPAVSASVELPQFFGDCEAVAGESSSVCPLPPTTPPAAEQDRGMDAPAQQSGCSDGSCDYQQPRRRFLGRWR